MVSIRGPSSALTDFIREHGIVVKPKEVLAKLQNPITISPKKHKQKKVRLSQPFEMTNLNSEVTLKEQEFFEKLTQLYEYESKFTDKEIIEITKFCANKRLIDEKVFNAIINKSNDCVRVYDCSKIKDKDFLTIKNCTNIELHYCGQLSNFACNEILKNSPRLTHLVLTGAYLITDVTLPNYLIFLDFSYCSRLDNSIIAEINKQYYFLDTLKLSYCYGINEKCKINTKIKNLYLCETNVNLDFICPENYEDIKSLSFKRCPNIFAREDDYKGYEFYGFTNLKYLDIEGISTIKSLNLNSKLEYLNISYCYFFNINSVSDQTELKILNVSRVKLNIGDLNVISKFTALEELNMSWQEIIDDSSIIFLIENLPNLKELHVFGCFNLTEKSAKYAWENRANIKIFGIPSETQFIIEN